MAVRRCRCGYTTDDVFADGCPLCLRPMALVNDAGPAAAYACRARTHIRWKLLLIIAAVGISSLTGLCLELFSLNRGPAAAAPVADQPPNLLKADSTGRIRVGMHIGRVAKELEPVAVRNEPPGTTLSDVLPRDSTSGGVLYCQKDRRQLFVFFKDGFVSGVEELPGQPGQAEWAEVGLNEGRPSQAGPP